jgi:hypothetical protein
MTALISSSRGNDMAAATRPSATGGEHGPHFAPGLVVRAAMVQQPDQRRRILYPEQAGRVGRLERLHRGLERVALVQLQNPFQHASPDLELITRRYDVPGCCALAVARLQPLAAAGGALA